MVPMRVEWAYQVANVYFQRERDTMSYPIMLTPKMMHMSMGPSRPLEPAVHAHSPVHPVDITDL